MHSSRPVIESFAPYKSVSSVCSVLWKLHIFMNFIALFFPRNQEKVNKVLLILPNPLYAHTVLYHVTSDSPIINTALYLETLNMYLTRRFSNVNTNFAICSLFVIHSKKYHHSWVCPQVVLCHSRKSNNRICCFINVANLNYNCENLNLTKWLISFALGEQAKTQSRRDWQGRLHTRLCLITRLSADMAMHPAAVQPCGSKH